MGVGLTGVASIPVFSENTLTDSISGNQDASSVSGGVAVRTQSADSTKTRFQFDEGNTGVALDGTAPKSTIESLWTTTIDGSVKSSPAVVGDSLYLTSSEALYALSTSDGSIQWRVDWDEPEEVTGSRAGLLSYSSPAVVDETIYAGSIDSNVYAVDTDDGTIQWTKSTRGPVYASPQVRDGSVYVGCLEGQCYSLDAENGSTEWSKTFDPIAGAPVLVEDLVCFGFGLSQMVRFDDPQLNNGPGSVQAFDAETGSRRWRFPETFNDPLVPGEQGRQIGGIPVALTASSGKIYFYTRETSHSGGSNRSMTLHALDATDGTELWNQPHPQDLYGSFAANGDTLYGWAHAGQGRYEFCALDANSGIVLWSRSFSGNWDHPRPPIVANDAIYVCGPGQSDDTVYALNVDDGTVLWSYDTGTFGTGPPAPVGGTVYLGDNAGTVVALGTDGELDVSVAVNQSHPLPDETVTLTFTVQNLSSVDVAPTLRIGSLPDEINVENHTDDGGSYEDGDTPMWTWPSITTGDSVSSSLTFSFSENIESGEYTVAAIATAVDNDSFPEFSAEQIITLVENEFAQYKGKKQSLADQITEAAEILDESATVEAALSHLTDSKAAGEVDEETATEAVQRMILAENITERAIRSVGPAKDRPDGANTNLANTIALHTLNTATTLATTGAMLWKTVKLLPQSLQRYFRSGMYNILDESIGFFQTYTRQQRNVVKLLGADGPIGEYFENVHNLANPAPTAGRIFFGMGDKKEELAKEIQIALEGGDERNGVAGAIEDVTKTLSGQKDIGSTPTFLGHYSDAQQLSKETADKITETVRNAEESLNDSQAQKYLTDILSVVMGALREYFRLVVATSPVQMSGPITAATGLSVMFAALSQVFRIWSQIIEPLVTLTDGVISLYRVQILHKEGIEAVINPGGSI